MGTGNNNQPGLFPVADTLADYLEERLAILSIGLNPSPVSVAAGYYFAGSRNRFWPALNGSRLVDKTLVPGPEAMRTLLQHYHIGFTDLVKRPTPQGRELRAADYRSGAAELQDKILFYRPAIAWFHGILAYRNYLKYNGVDDTGVGLGLQKRSIGASRVFVTPNPSPANARYSLDDIIRHYNTMVSFKVREAFGLGA